MTQEEIKELLKKYADATLQKNIFEEVIDEIKPQILAYLQENKADQIKSDFGTFTVVSKRKYDYSPEVLRIENELKEAKLREEQSGEAKYSESSYFRFSTNQE